jgi:hypothetical protein
MKSSMSQRKMWRELTDRLSMESPSTVRPKDLVVVLTTHTLHHSGSAAADADGIQILTMMAAMAAYGR